jgi:hypothetical protein
VKFGQDGAGVQGAEVTTLRADAAWSMARPQGRAWLISRMDPGGREEGGMEVDPKANAPAGSQRGRFDGGMGERAREATATVWIDAGSRADQGYQWRRFAGNDWAQHAVRARVLGPETGFRRLGGEETA